MATQRGFVPALIRKIINTMMLSLCVLGYGPLGQAFTKKFKELEYYKLHDGDRSKVRIHTVVVTSNSSSKYEDLRFVYDRQPEGRFCCLNDGTQMTPRETPLTDDIPWLKQTTGHDVVIDFTTSNDDSRDLVLQQISRQYWTFLVNKDLVKNYWREIISVAKQHGTRLSFNAIAAGIDKYSDIDLNQDTFPSYAEDLDLYQADAPIDAVVDLILAELDTEYWIRLKKDEAWWARSEEERAAVVAREHEEHERIRLAAPPVPPKPSKNKVSQVDACGLNDTVDWDKYKA